MPPLHIPVYGIVTLGGVVVGLGLFLWDASRWWADHPKKRFHLKALKKLAPILACDAYGALLILCAGGIIGAAADWSLWGSNTVGEVVLVYGVGGTSPDVTRASQLALTPGGHAVVILATIVLIAVASRRGFRWDFVRQTLAGISLGLAKSVAGLVGLVVAPTVSMAGDWFMGLW
ncbi:hypothetical protein [Streptomyces shenzhenensis]|uniref:Uncharacterized protein n=1 Tax=Streptomyces shenzhenensis TaxID=943815 RepID=A0A3M0I7S9_9ACTN|nr:hypothetical protein [Streptomyces shenzhenensis]RMB85611.1 hypothetical protein CTZ28_12525 [Streptomyces shenzhenensis]